jgi:predicted small integral membrane protein
MRDHVWAILSPWQEARDRLVATRPTSRDWLFLAALPAFMILYIVGLFVGLGWWGIVALLMYLASVVGLGAVVGRSRQSLATRSALAVLVPALCVAVLAAIPRALGLI